MSTPQEVDPAEEEASAPATAPAAPSRFECDRGYRHRVYDDAVVMCETLAEKVGRTCAAAR